MMKKIALILSLVLLALPVAASEERVTSPDGRLVVTVSDEGAMPTYSVTYDGIPFLWRSPLGLKSDIGDFTQGVRLAGWLLEGPVTDDSETLPQVKRTRPCFTRSRLALQTFSLSCSNITIDFSTLLEMTKEDYQK